MANLKQGNKNIKDKKTEPVNKIQEKHVESAANMQSEKKTLWMGQTGLIEKDAKG